MINKVLSLKHTLKPGTLNASFLYNKQPAFKFKTRGPVFGNTGPLITNTKIYTLRLSMCF